MDLYLKQMNVMDKAICRVQRSPNWRLTFHLFQLHIQHMTFIFSIKTNMSKKARRMRWVGHVARVGEVRGGYNILVGRPEGRRPLGRPRCRWENNIKMDLREIGFGDVDWMYWAQDRDRWRAVVNTVMNLRVP
jgi:hypothetical protein